MTQLYSGKSKQGLTPVWDMAVRTVTGSGGVRSGLWGVALTNSNSPESPGSLPGTFHFWKRHGGRFYAVNTHYFIPATKRPGSGFPVTVLALHPADRDGEWRLAAERLCQDGAVVIAVELPGAHATLARQVETLLEATWVAIDLKIGGLAGSPVQLTWWGSGETAVVVEQAARLSGYKYYLPSERVLTRPFGEMEAAPAAQTGPEDLTLAKAS